MKFIHIGIAIWVIGGIFISYFLHDIIYSAKNKKSYPDSVVNYQNEKNSFSSSQNSNYQIIKRYSRTTNRFTQGLTFINETTLLESTGLYNSSKIFYIDLESQKIISQYNLEFNYFGEGSDIFQNEDGTKYIYMLTWREREVFVFDENLQLINKIPLPNIIKEGWGLCKYTDKTNKQWILVSDGSEYIYFINKTDFTVSKQLKVQQFVNNKAVNVQYLNELEIYKGYLLANIYMTNKIAQINLENGNVEQQLDFYQLTREAEEIIGKHVSTSHGYCLNGIAYNYKRDTILLTGKMWPFVFEIQLTLKLT